MWVVTPYAHGGGVVLLWWEVGGMEWMRSKVLYVVRNKGVVASLERQPFLLFCSHSYKDLKFKRPPSNQC
jgi:hypothetical protein